MQTYFFSRMYRFFVVIPLAITTLSYGMMVKQQDAPRFKTKDEISTALPFAAGMLCGAVAPLISPVMTSITKHAVDTSLVASLIPLQCMLIIPVMLVGEDKTHGQLYRLERLLLRAPISGEPTKDAIGKLGKELWTSGSLVKNNDSEYTRLCAKYNKLLEQHVTDKAMISGSMLGCLCAVFGVSGFRWYTGDWSTDVSDTLSRMCNELD